MRLLTRTPSRARRIRVFGLPPRLTTRPPRCFVRVVSLGGWCGVQRRARDGEPSANGGNRRQRIGREQSGKSGSKSKSTATATEQVTRDQGERQARLSAKAKRGSRPRGREAARPACSGYGTTACRRAPARRARRRGGGSRSPSMRARAGPACVNWSCSNAGRRHSAQRERHTRQPT